MDSIRNFFSKPKNYENSYPKKIQACCPNCQYNYEMEIKYKISIEVETKLTNEEMRNFEIQRTEFSTQEPK
jgi:hypothetical protein